MASRDQGSGSDVGNAFIDIRYILVNSCSRDKFLPLARRDPVIVNISNLDRPIPLNLCFCFVDICRVW